MKRLSLSALSAFSLSALLFTSTSAEAQVSAVPAAMNFQGRLAKPDGTPVSNGTYSVLFSLYDALSGGNLKWSQTVNPVTVRNGTFAVNLSGFPAGTFNGNLWLEIKIGSNAALTPRQPLVSVAYALKADSVKDGAITSASIADGSITATKLASGAITSASLNPLAWLLTGNSGVTSGFLGTTDTNPLEIRVNNRRAVRYSYAENTTSAYRGINVLGGSDINTIGAGVVGATIAGGGLDSFTGTDFPNTVTGSYGTIGGGFGNTAIGVGSTVGGGTYGTASNGATVGGGYQNIASGSSYATVAGGLYNTASGYAATVPGGYFNQAGGAFSFAAGVNAQALHDGAFVWADNQSGNFSSTGVNQFCVRATGGIIAEANGSFPFYTSATSGEKNRYLDLLNSPLSPSASGLKAGGILCADSYDYASPGKNDMIVKGNLTTGDTIDARKYLLVGGAHTSSDGLYVANFSGSTITYGNSLAYGFYAISDARYKKNIVPLGNALDQVLALRGVSYNWNKEKFPDQKFGDGKQMGFLAQEVEQIFPELVQTDANGYKSVNYVGVVPVLVEAVKSQQKKIDVLTAKMGEVDALKAKNASLEADNAMIKAKLAALADAVKRIQRDRP